MSQNIENRLYIATVCSQCEQISKEYGIGIELDQFCMAEKMDGEEYEKVKQEIDLLLLQQAADDKQNTNVRRQAASLQKRTLQNGPLLKRTLHAPFNELFPAAIDPKARALAMERLQRSAELAMYYKADKMIVHSGYMPFVYFKEWHIARSVEFWNEFMDGKPDGFKIVIENVLEDEPYMMAEMMTQIANPNIKLCLDTGHANCMSQMSVMEWLKVMAPYLGHLHIHNNDKSHDYHKPLDEGTIDMEEFLDSALENISEETTITIESLEGHSSMKWLQKKGYI